MSIIKKIFNRNIRLNYFKVFLNYLFLDLLNIKNINARVIYIKTVLARDTYI